MHVTLTGLAASLAGGLLGYIAARAQERRGHRGRQRPHVTLAGDQARSLQQNGGRSRDPCDPRPRDEYLSWDDYFMAVAFLSAQRSKDPAKQVGACIVSRERVILGIGYNGFPRGCPDSELPWAKLSRSGDPLETKYPYVCHAELNAILNKNTASLEGAKMYVTMFPCNECSKLLIQAGIKEVVFYEDKAVVPVRDTSPNEGSNVRKEDAFTASKRLLHMTGVRVRQHRLDRPLVFSIGVGEQLNGGGSKALP